MESECNDVYVLAKRGSVKRLLVKSGEQSETFYERRTAEARRPLIKAASSSTLRAYNRSGKLLSLFDSCVAFVASHLDLLESLEDFPDDIALQIWRAAERDENYICELNLAAFSTAYTELFLPSCQISSLLLLDNYDSLLPDLLASVSRLDLTGCEMGDDHEVVAALNKLPFLSVLSLKSNLLTDAGVRNLLMPKLMRPEAFRKLDYLDLRDNPVGIKSLQRISASLPGLSRLALSCPEGPTLGQFREALKPSFRLQARPHLEHIVTEGWASTLIAKWGRRLSEMRMSRKRKREDESERDDFYGTGAKKQPLAMRKTANETVRHVDVMFCRQPQAMATVPFQEQRPISSLPIETHKYDDDAIMSMYK